MNGVSVKPYMAISYSSEFKFGDEGTSVSVHDRAYPTKFGLDGSTEVGSKEKLSFNVEARHTGEGDLELHSATVAVKRDDHYVQAGLNMDVRKNNTLGVKVFHTPFDADLNAPSTTAGLHPKFDGVGYEGKFKSEVLPGSTGVVAVSVATPSAEATKDGGSLGVVVDGPQLRGGVMVAKNPFTGDIGAVVSIEDKDTKTKLIAASNFTQERNVVTVSNQYDSGRNTFLTQAQIDMSPASKEVSGAIACLRSLGTGASAISSATVAHRLDDGQTSGKVLAGLRFTI